MMFINICLIVILNK